LIGQASDLQWCLNDQHLLLKRSHISCYSNQVFPKRFNKGTKLLFQDYFAFRDANDTVFFLNHAKIAVYGYAA
jgi:hypothetical protein